MNHPDHNTADEPRGSSAISSGVRRDRSSLREPKEGEKKRGDWAQGIQTDAFKDGFHLVAGMDLNMVDQQRNEEDLLACERQAMRGGRLGVRLRTARTIVGLTGISHELQG